MGNDTITLKHESKTVNNCNYYYYYFVYTVTVSFVFCLVNLECRWDAICFVTVYCFIFYVNY